MKTIDVTAFRRIAEGPNPPPILDVRTPGEFQSVHVPGAALHPLDGLDAAGLAARFAGAATGVYLLCHSGGRAKKAAEKLEAAGLSGCVVVAGGTEAWQQAGFPLERGEGGVLPLPRQMQAIMGTIVLAAVLLGQSVHPAWNWLAGFVGAGLLMAGLTDYCPARTLLAKAPWNQRVAGSGKPTCCAP